MRRGKARILVVSGLVVSLIAQPLGAAQASQPGAWSAAALASRIEPPNGSVTLTPHAPSPACLKSADPTLEPEGLQLTHTGFADPAVPQTWSLRDGNGYSVTGDGVKVAYIAEGIDTHNPEFVRPKDSPFGKAGPVFIDYKDFTGEGTAAPTTGAEAFVDAGTIGAQGNRTYDVNTYDGGLLAGPCRIQIVGVVPGASLVGLRAIGTRLASAPEAEAAAIDYAVNVDHVDVINESFGSYSYPDQGNDPVSLANARAIAAGVTIAAASGDAGVQGTLESPANNDGVIGVGATTQFRRYIQMADGLSTLGNGGYLSDNMASLSSAGVSQFGLRTVDVVAPGDGGWVPCTTTKTTTKTTPPAYASCTDRSGIYPAGGTSEATPFVAGEAALVIQAYRSTHGGANPSPAVVKQIILSTATDLGIPAVEQGAGLINSYRAVQAALSYRDTTATPAPRAAALLLADTTALTATAAPGTAETFRAGVTNTGAGRQLVAPRVLRLGPPTAETTYTRTIDPLSDPHVNLDGNAYIEQDFPVRPGAQRLEATLAWLASQQPRAVVRLSLFDPSGRFAAYSAPNDNGAPIQTSGYGQVSVRSPKPGLWKAILATNGAAVPSSYHGAVTLHVATYRFVAAGTVSPPAATVSPGGQVLFTVHTRTPASPGDAVAEVAFPNSSGGGALLGAIPIALRSLVPLGTAGGSFSGTFLGGNGANSSPSQYQPYAFDVPGGLHDLDVSVQVADPNNSLQGVLIDPAGQPIDVQSTVGGVNAYGQPAYYTGTIQLFRHDPAPGRWLFVLVVVNNVSGAATAQAFSARIGFNQVRLLTRGIPNSATTTLKAGVPVDAEIALANSGPTAKELFLDPRLDTTAPVSLSRSTFTETLPITASAPPALIFLPPAVSDLEVMATASSPVSFGVYNVNGTQPWGITGSPYLSGTTAADAAGASTGRISIQAPELAPGRWAIAPAVEIGPFGARGAVPGTVVLHIAAYGMPFDHSVQSSTGDPWSSPSAHYTPLRLIPGGEGTIQVRFTPRGAPGTVVRGFLYLLTRNRITQSNDEPAAIPYTYTIGPKGQ